MARGHLEPLLQGVIGGRRLTRRRRATRARSTDAGTTTLVASSLAASLRPGRPLWLPPSRRPCCCAPTSAWASWKPCSPSMSRRRGRLCSRAWRTSTWAAVKLAWTLSPSICRWTSTGPRSFGVILIWAWPIFCSASQVRRVPTASSKPSPCRSGVGVGLALNTALVSWVRLAALVSGQVGQDEGRAVDARSSGIGIATVGQLGLAGEVGGGQGGQGVGVGCGRVAGSRGGRQAR